MQGQAERNSRRMDEEKRGRGSSGGEDKKKVKDELERKQGCTGKWGVTGRNQQTRVACKLLQGKNVIRKRLARREGVARGGRFHTKVQHRHESQRFMRMLKRFRGTG